MSELLTPPDPARFPRLDADSAWVREVPAGTALTRIFRTAGPYPTEWHDFREFGPLDARFDPHPEPTGEHPGEGVLYAALESAAVAGGSNAPSASASDSPFAVCLLEVFQQFRIIQRGFGRPTMVVFEVSRPLRLLDLSDSDWIAVAGGNAALTSGEHGPARAWARAIRASYPEIDGVVAASSLVPSARTVALWEPARTAIPRHPLALLRLDRGELTGVIDSIADRYGYLLL